jgi:hypothetical protein
VTFSRASSTSTWVWIEVVESHSSML